MTETDKSLTRVIDAYAAAVFARDAAALMRLYDPEVRVFDAWGIWSYEGAAAWQAAVEAWFTSLGSERVKVRFDELRSWSAGRDLAMVSAFVTYASVAADGRALRSMGNRLSWGLRTSGHVLRIVHEHSSAPIGFDDMKAILQRNTAA